MLVFRSFFTCTSFSTNLPLLRLSLISRTTHWLLRFSSSDHDVKYYIRSLDVDGASRTNSSQVSGFPSAYRAFYFVKFSVIRLSIIYSFVASSSTFSFYFSVLYILYVVLFYIIRLVRNLWYIFYLLHRSVTDLLGLLSLLLTCCSLSFRPLLDVYYLSAYPTWFPISTFWTCVRLPFICRARSYCCTLPLLLRARESCALCLSQSRS